MSLTPEQITAHLAALEAAILRGALEVQQGNERVRYGSIAEMIKAAERGRALLAGSQGARPTHFNPTFDRGV